jgi:type I restriction enzyme R subunit
VKLAEREVCTKHILPVLTRAGRDVGTQVREDINFTKSRVIVRGQLPSSEPRVPRATAD